MSRWPTVSPQQLQVEDPEVRCVEPTTYSHGCDILLPVLKRGTAFFQVACLKALLLFLQDIFLGTVGVIFAR